jgi:O-antigen ligase
MTTYADRLLDLTFRVPGWVVAVLSAAVAGLLGWTYVTRPTLALLPALLLLALPLVLSARARFIVVVFGALTVFQSSDELTTSKLAYLLALGISFGAVLVRVPTLVGTPGFRDLTPLLRASLVTFALIAVSLPVSAFNDVPQKAWLRDVAPYVMVACAPFFALDAQASMRRATLERILLVAGTLGALGFTARWLTNRGIADLSFVSVGLPTLILAAAVFASGLGALLHGQHKRLAWAAFTAAIFAMLISTGTRTALVLLAGPLAIVVGSRQRIAQRSIRLVAAVPLLAALVFLGTQGIVRATDADTRILTERASLLFSTGERASDRSYIDRLAQTDSALEMFRSSPLIGAGPGTPIVWSNSFNEVQVSTVIDSPLSFLAKFGVLGLVAPAALVVGFVGTLRALRRRTDMRTIPQLALIGFGAIVAAWSLLYNPYEDKGFSIALVLLLALAAREASDAALESRRRLEESTTD